MKCISLETSARMLISVTAQTLRGSAVGRDQDRAVSGMALGALHPSA
ncbi:MAG: hypothetical protein JOZ53_21435 [Planctomycetaceae bacterium]|nr:hypothetical protein [Planctomycetaceae bacterium]